MELDNLINGLDLELDLDNLIKNDTCRLQVSSGRSHLYSFIYLFLFTLESPCSLNQCSTPLDASNEIRNFLLGKDIYRQEKINFAANDFRQSCMGRTHFHCNKYVIPAQMWSP